jgi:DNA-binding MarR family transcriptional regulator
MSQAYPEQHRTLGALLRIPFQHLATRVYEQIDQSTKGTVRPAHGAVFRYIEPAGSRVTALAERAGITKQSMAALVEHLAAHGYVAVEADPGDGRARLVKLTRRGAAVQRQARELSSKVEMEWADAIGEEEMRVLRVLLEKLYDHLTSSGR